MSEHPLDQFRAMSDAELVEQAGEVISAVLDYWEGDDDAIHEYGEIRAKQLLAALRERWPRP